MRTNLDFEAMNNMFFEWYVKPTVWYSTHEACGTCCDGKPTKACYIAFLKTLGDPEEMR